MPVMDIDGTTRNMFGISVGNQRIDIRSNAGEYEIRNNLGVWRKVQTRTYLSGSAPTASNDSSQGYLLGDEWFDTTTTKKYLCLDATIGAAVWYWYNQAVGPTTSTRWQRWLEHD
jgi:hypothetical protein